jgi:hypothetical protein
MTEFVVASLQRATPIRMGQADWRGFGWMVCKAKKFVKL